VTQNPSLGEELVIVEALRSSFVELGVFDDRLSSIILSVDSGTSRNIVVDLSGAAEIFAQMLVSVDTSIKEEKVKLGLHVKEELLLQAGRHMGSDLGVKIISDRFQSLVSDQRARSVISDEILGLKNVFWVVSEIGSVSAAISRVSL